MIEATPYVYSVRPLLVSDYDKLFLTTSPLERVWYYLHSINQQAVLLFLTKLSSFFYRAFLFLSPNEVL